MTAQKPITTTAKLDQFLGIDMEIAAIFQQETGGTVYMSSLRTFQNGANDSLDEDYETSYNELVKPSPTEKKKRGRPKGSANLKRWEV